MLECVHPHKHNVANRVYVNSHPHSTCNSSSCDTSEVSANNYTNNAFAGSNNNNNHARTAIARTPPATAMSPSSPSSSSSITKRSERKANKVRFSNIRAMVETALHSPPVLSRPEEWSGVLVDFLDCCLQVCLCACMMYLRVL